MLTKPIAIKFWHKICIAPSSWFYSKEGKKLTKEMINIIKDKEGEEEAKIFESLCLLAESVR